MACTLKVTITALLFLATAALTCCHAVSDWSGICKRSDIHVSVARTGKTVAGQPQYKVTIENKCVCPQVSVTVRCLGGLQSTEPVDDSKIHVEGDGECMVNHDLPIARGSPVTFTYAWKRPRKFPVTMARTADICAVLRD